MTINKYHGWTPARPEHKKKRRKTTRAAVWAPAGLGFGNQPARPTCGAAMNRCGFGSGSARITRNYPRPRRDMGWVWDWVLGLSNISGILENDCDFNFQYFQDSGECCRPRGSLSDNM